jgi:hypothetical protein
MREQLEQRLQELKSEFDLGQKMMAELDAKQAHLKNSLWRISGAIQVLEELLEQAPHNAEAPVGAKASAMASVANG